MFIEGNLAMNQITIVEYKNITSCDKKPFGHGLKVLNEAAWLSKKMGYCVNISAADEFLRSVDSISQYRLHKQPYTILAGKYSFHTLVKILSNIRTAFITSNSEIYWFTNVDWFLLLYLGLTNVNKKIVITVYRDIFDEINSIGEGRGIIGTILRKIVKRGCQRVKCVVKTFRMDVKFNGPTVFMPDYLYSDFYSQYNSSKNNRVLCIGTMNLADKDISGLVSAFNDSDIELDLYGKFVNDDDFIRIKHLCGKNTTIHNQYLESDDYYKILGSYKYVILPYRMEKYESSTSGILREALYLGAVIIGPEILLHSMGITGIGYEQIESVPSLISSNVDTVFHNDFSQYSEDIIVEKLKKAFEELL